MTRHLSQTPNTQIKKAAQIEAIRQASVDAACTAEGHADAGRLNEARTWAQVSLAFSAVLNNLSDE